MQGNQIPLVFQSRHVAAGRYVLSPSSQFSFVAWSPNQGTGKVRRHLALTDGRPVKVTIMVWNIQLGLSRTSHYLRIPECPVQLYNCLFDFIHTASYWIKRPPPTPPRPHPPFLVPKMFIPINPRKKKKNVVQLSVPLESPRLGHVFVCCFAIFGPSDKKL
jgi:hypothetical protein